MDGSVVLLVVGFTFAVTCGLDAGDMYDSLVLLVVGFTLEVTSGLHTG